VIKWGGHGFNSLHPLEVRLYNQVRRFTMFTIHGTWGSSVKISLEHSWIIRKYSGPTVYHVYHPWNMGKFCEKFLRTSMDQKEVLNSDGLPCLPSMEHGENFLRTSMDHKEVLRGFSVKISLEKKFI
jgi:hypothetical protein